MFEINTIIFALTGGLLPALIWLFFWLKEDELHPEPRKMIFKTFFYGMLSVPIVLVIQLLLNKFIFGDIDINEIFKNSTTFPLIGIFMILSWAATEEIFKYIAALKGGLSSKEHDEPLDDLIYMITAALGFAALENAFFLFAPLINGDTELAIITGNMRFIGATLLHVSTASIIGAFRAFCHFKKGHIQKRYILSGVILATALHTAFNLFIINEVESTFVAFSVNWIVIIIIILIFERIKRIYVEEIKK